MEPLVIYIKTYSVDLALCGRLVESIRKYNVDNIPVVISTNPGETALFRDELDLSGFTVIDDSEYFVPSVSVDGWRALAAVRGSFWKTRIAKNYLAVDSDGYFIKPFKFKDFMYTDEIPYTVMHEGKDMLDYMAVNRPNEVKRPFFQNVSRGLRAKYGINRDQHVWDWGPNPYIWNADVWEALCNAIKKPLDLANWEMEQQQGALPADGQFYGEWLWYSQMMRIIPRQPLFKVYHWQHQYQQDMMNGVTDEMLSNHYYGVIRQSKWVNPNHPEAYHE